MTSVKPLPDGVEVVTMRDDEAQKILEEFCGQFGGTPDELKEEIKNCSDPVAAWLSVSMTVDELRAWRANVWRSLH